MPTVEVNITPNVLNWALDQVQVEALNIKILENISRWRTGEKVPTFNQVEDLSKATNIPLGYFFLQVPPEEDLSILKYRTIDSLEFEQPSRDLLDTITDMENVQEWMREYMIREGEAKLDFVGSKMQTTNVLQIASSIRDTLKLKEDWHKGKKNAWDSFKYLRKNLENAGMVVMVNGVVRQNNHRKLKIEEFRAFTLIDDYAPLIFINTNDSANGKLFSLLHEVAHIWFGVNDLYNDRYNIAGNVNQIEKNCNAVAAEILVPNNAFVREWDKYDDNKTAIEKANLLAKTFKCGVTVIARRAFDNGFIEQNLYHTIAEEAIQHYNEQKESDESSGGNYYNTAGTRIDNRFLIALDNSINEGKILFTDAYRLTNTNRKTFSKLLEKVRGLEYDE